MGEDSNCKKKQELLELGIKKRDHELKHEDGTEYSWDEIGAMFGKTGEQARNYVRKNLHKVSSDNTEETETKGKYKGTKEGQEERKPKITDMGDYYRVTSGIRNIIITKEKLRKIKEMYCDDSPLTMNNICRELQIPRPEFFVIKTAFSIVHNDVPFIDEDLMNGDIDDLVDDTLEKRKKKYFNKLQEKEIVNLKNELAIYRRKDYFLSKMQGMVEESLAKLSDKLKEPIPNYPLVTNGRMLEVPIVDLHLNKLAWNQETGEDYDSKIAVQRFQEVILKLKQRITGQEFEKIIFPIGNDYFNIDTPTNTTTAGTRQDVDSRWAKMYTTGIELLVWAINELAQIAPVYVFLVTGNHDTMTSFFAICNVQSFFRNEPKVTVDINPQSRKYVWFGNTLIGFSHMNKEKKRIEGNMQVEAPEAWGQTKYREWHGAHLHSEQTKEMNGIIIRNLSSITGSDYWHDSSGYVGAIARTQVFIWDKVEGLYDIKYITIESNSNKYIIKL